MNKMQIKRLLGIALLAAIIAVCIHPVFAADYRPLIGKWQRTDGGYVIEIRRVAPDGTLEANYFNPRPINVSAAEWQLKDGYLMVFVKLSDEGYPGSSYTLVYHPDSDRLAGVYFQAALQRKFEVVFERVKPKSGS